MAGSKEERHTIGPDSLSRQRAWKLGLVYLMGASMQDPTCVACCRVMEPDDAMLGPVWCAQGAVLRGDKPNAGAIVRAITLLS